MFAIGIDIGGTKTAAGLVSFPEGKVEQCVVWPTPARSEQRGRLDAEIIARAHQLQQIAESQNQSVAGIGIGICELVNKEGKICSQNAIDLEDSDLAAQLSKIAPTVFQADVRAAALAEARFGGGKGREIFLYVTIGTGVSCSLVIEGKPFGGAHGYTGTMGSSPLASFCAPCDQLRETSLEEFASGPALARRCDVASAKEALGRPEAARAIISAATMMGGTIGLLVNTLDPAAIVVGGGLGLASGLYWETMTASIRAHIWSPLHREIPILQAQTGDKAGVIGAALYAVDTLGD